MKKILLVTDRLPGDRMSGGALKTKKMIEHLGEWYQLKILCLSVSDTTQEKAQPDVTVLPLSSNQFAASPSNLLKSYFLKVPLSVARNRSYVSVDEYDHLFKWCDLVIIDHFFMYSYVPESFGKKVVLHQHNAEYVLWCRKYENEKNIIKRNIMKLECRRVQSYEQKICTSANLVLAAPNDILALSKLGIPLEKFKETLHLGDDSLLATDVSNISELDPQLCFLGGLSWHANLDGLNWFLENCWETLCGIDNNIVLNVIGECDESIRIKLGKYHNVILHGYVDNLNDVLSNVRVFVSPLLYGSGMKVKNITALYKGLPIVTTSVGAEGIELQDSVNSFIADSPSLFVQRVAELLADDYKSQLMAQSARNLALNKYSWGVHLNQIRSNLDELLAIDG